MKNPAGRDNNDSKKGRGKEKKRGSPKDDDDVDEFIDEASVNDNGTPVFYASHINADTPKVYTLASTGPITATFMSMASESLAELNAGEVHVYLGIQKLSDL